MATKLVKVKDVKQAMLLWQAGILYNDKGRKFGPWNEYPDYHDQKYFDKYALQYAHVMVEE